MVDFLKSNSWVIWVPVIVIGVAVGVVLAILMIREFRPKESAEDKQAIDSLAIKLREITSKYGGAVYTRFALKQKKQSIQILFLSRGGLFVVEFSNQVGKLLGDSNEPTWRLVGDSKSFPNPMIKTQRKADYLAANLLSKVEVNHFVIFPKADLLYVACKNAVKENQLIVTLETATKASKYSASQINELNRLLKNFK